MNERPILFSGAMVRAILSGTKTQTRRAINPAPHPGRYGPLHPTSPNGNIGPTLGALGGGDYHVWEGPHATAPLTTNGAYVALRQCPYGVPGDRLWVRETFYSTHTNEEQARTNGQTHYRADVDELGEEMLSVKWKPSIFMPRWASRITLEITDVRVQRLQEISGQDAEAEGVTLSPSTLFPQTNRGDKMKREYEKLWDSINIKRAPWASNPWIWAITFRPTPQSAKSKTI